MYQSLSSGPTSLDDDDNDDDQVSKRSQEFGEPRPTKKHRIDGSQMLPAIPVADKTVTFENDTQCAQSSSEFTFSIVSYRILGESYHHQETKNFHNASTIQAFREWVETKHKMECHSILDEITGEAKCQDQLVLTSLDFIPKFVLIPTKVGIVFRWIQNGAHKSTTKIADASDTVRTVLERFKNKHGPHLQFKRITGANFLHTHSRFSDEKSIEDDRIMDFWNLIGPLTIEMIHAGLGLVHANVSFVNV